MHVACYGYCAPLYRSSHVRSTQHWDGTGGNGSALRHYEATGRKYPLVVKLGTITPNGADVYSYADDEDDMVWRWEWRWGVVVGGVASRILLPSLPVNLLQCSLL